MKSRFQFFALAAAISVGAAWADEPSAQAPGPIVRWRERCVTRLQNAVGEGYREHTFLGPAMAVREPKTAGMRLAEKRGPSLAAMVDERPAAGPVALDEWRPSIAGRKHQIHVERRRGDRVGSLIADGIPRRDIDDVTKIFQVAIDDCLALPPDPPLAGPICLPVIYQGTQCVIGCGLGRPAGEQFQITVEKCALSGYVDDHFCRNGACRPAFVGDNLCRANPLAMAVMEPVCDRTDDPGCVLDGNGCRATRPSKPPRP